MFRQADVVSWIPRIRACIKRFSKAGHVDEASSNRAPETAGCRRLKLIEGMRAYLAFWVVLCHVLWFSGYTQQLLSGPKRLLVEGRCAVDVFIIISGFVIFFLLDHQQDTWRPFILRRFFRLFPLFAVLFPAAIIVSRLTSWNVSSVGKYWAPDQIQYMSGLVVSWWQNLRWHVPLHLLILPGPV